MQSWISGIVVKVGTLLFEIIVKKIINLIYGIKLRYERRSNDKKNAEKLKDDIKKEGISDEQISNDAEDLLNGR